MFKSISRRLNTHHHGYSQLTSCVPAMCRGKEGIYFIPDVTKKGAHHLYSPLTTFNSQREVFCLAQQYQEELIRMTSVQKTLFPLVLIYDHYQDLYQATEEKKLREEMEYFYARAIPEIRLIDKVKDTLMLYEGAYEIYQKDPSSFQSYYYLSLLMNDLLNETINERTITAYVRSFIANHPSECFKLSQITFNNERRSAVAHYDPNSQTLNISDVFFRESPSEQAFNILHELKHTTQRPCFMDDVFAMAKDEQEADEFASRNIKCDLCLRVTQLARQTFPIGLPGYFQADSFNRYIQLSNVRCKAHSGCDADLLEKEFRNGNIYSVRDLDRSMGTLFDRLPVLEPS